MMHAQIDTDETIDRYVRRQLPPEEQDAFETHFFGCDECFEKVQAAERFRAAIRDASVHGLLDDESPAAGAAAGSWWKWALTATVAASAALAVAAGWMYFGELPRLRDDLTRTTASLAKEREARNALAQSVRPPEEAEANVALVMLQASRAAQDPANAILPAGARHLVLWIEIGPSRFRSFRLEVMTPDNRAITSLDRLERGPYGALVVNIPADKLPAGNVRFMLSGQDPVPAALVGEYIVSIQKR